MSERLHIRDAYGNARCGRQVRRPMLNIRAFGRLLEEDEDLKRICEQCFQKADDALIFIDNAKRRMN